MMLGGLVELIAIRIDLPKEVQLLSMTFLIVVNDKLQIFLIKKKFYLLHSYCGIQMANTISLFIAIHNI